MIFGYARVSTDGQSVAAQVAALRKHGAGQVFRETASGAKTDRAQLHRLLHNLDGGDVVMVTRLDRPARSTRDLLNTLAAITEKKAGFRSLGDSWADTTTAHGRLMLTVLGGLAGLSATLSAPAPPKTGAAPRPRESIWGGPFPSQRNRKRPQDGARRALRCRNWRIATTAAYPPCAAPPAPRDKIQTVTPGAIVERTSSSVRHWRSRGTCRRRIRQTVGRRSTTPAAAKQSGGTGYADKGPTIAQGFGGSCGRVRPSERPGVISTLRPR
jgi:Resolvase, N terminal domain